MVLSVLHGPAKRHDCCRKGRYVNRCLAIVCVELISFGIGMLRMQNQLVTAHKHDTLPSTGRQFKVIEFYKRSAGYTFFCRNILLRLYVLQHQTGAIVSWILTDSAIPVAIVPRNTYRQVLGW